ncbi:transmembrane protein 186 [Melanaphis sacchari]|uniref:transmembrane protein 186 n=1 Tax=Melanaphis sacchari TaxID=742174 RepID=UPI000DC12F89|nr:transmembrane protein 186 [Melanaphis sacchari]XP_025194862.1 transmembrane protein 186 [Melanaphis sacchari]
MLLLPKCINTIVLNNIKRNFMMKTCGLMHSKVNQIIIKDSKNDEFIPIYKTPHMKFFIGLNRIKIYQLVGLSCWIPMCFSLNMLSYINSDEVICASLIGLGLTAGLHIASWVISNNLVVFVYLSKNDQRCRMSYISYWGNREELYCNIEDITPIELSKLSILNHKIKLKGNSITFKIITRNSTILNNAKFRKVFGRNII